MNLATQSIAFEIANEMAATDIQCAEDRAEFIRRVIDAGEWDSAIDCDWELTTIVEEWKVARPVARQAIKLYPNALRAAAELRAAGG